MTNIPPPEVTSEEVEVKQGSAASVSCTAAKFGPEGVSLEWRNIGDITGTYSVTETTSESTTETSVDRSSTSVLSLDKVTSDYLFTCVAQSLGFPGSYAHQEIIHLKTYGE